MEIARERETEARGCIKLVAGGGMQCNAGDETRRDDAVACGTAVSAVASARAGGFDWVGSGTEDPQDPLYRN